MKTTIAAAVALMAAAAPLQAQTYQWVFDKYAVGNNATGAANDASLAILMADIVKLPDGSYRMYYGAAGTPGLPVGATTCIRSATSPDGITWSVEAGFRLVGDSGDGNPGADGILTNEGMISGPRAVRLSNGTYRMYYQASTMGTTPSDFRIKSATSADGLTWTREQTIVDITYPGGGAGLFSMAGHCYVIRFSDTDYVILISGNYNGSNAFQPSDLVIGTSADGLNFGGFSVLYTEGHDPYVVKLADNSGYRLFYGNLLLRQRTAFSAGGKLWPPSNQTEETVMYDATGAEQTEASTNTPGDRALLELSASNLLLFVNWVSPTSQDIVMMRPRSSASTSTTATGGGGGGGGGGLCCARTSDDGDAAGPLAAALLACLVLMGTARRLAA